jgi:hypothetical protein
MNNDDFSIVVFVYQSVYNLFVVSKFDKIWVDHLTISVQQSTTGKRILMVTTLGW